MAVKYLYAAAVTPNGAAVNVHRLQRVSLDAQRVLLTLNHYVDADQELPTWQDEYEMPLEQFQMGAYPDCVWEWISAPSGLFPTGQIMDGASSLDDAKKAKLHQIASMRDGRIAGGYQFQPIGTFDTDQRSTQNIMGGVQLALIAQTAGQPFSIAWRLADNTVATLDASAMIAVGAALAIYVSAVYQRSWELKELADTAATLEELEAIDFGSWPVGSNAA